MKNFRVLLALVVSGLSACNGDSGGSTAFSSSKVHKSKPAAVPKATQSREQQTVGMVSAASPSHSAAVGELKFDIRSRPVAGLPVSVDLALLPVLDSPAVTLDLKGSDGLQLSSGDERKGFVDVLSSNVYRDSVTLTPAAEGMYFLTVVATFKNADSAETRNYSIPIIAGPGPGLPASAGKQASAPAAGLAPPAPVPPATPRAPNVKH